MGVVFRARQTSLDRIVALKLIRTEHLYFRGSRERFRREVEAIAQLQHSGIISIHTVGEEAGLPFFAMELLGGPTLADILADLSNRAPESLTGMDLLRAVVGDGELPESPHELFRGSYVEACLSVAHQVAEALDHAHRREILHRDVKPSNIALRADGRAVLFDFGLTSSASSDSQGQRVTRTGALLGTLAYMSPEQVQGKTELDARTDVYSLGVALYELLTLHLPFGGRNSLQVQSRIQSGAADSIRARNRRVPEDAETVCRTAMALRPQDRYATAADFARDLANVLARNPIEAQPPGFLVRALRWSQRNVAAAVAIGLALLLLVGLPTGLLVQKSAYAGDLRRALESEQAALTASNTALEGERRARLQADEALRREQDALRSANTALQRESEARRQKSDALEQERRAREEAGRARDQATERLNETEDVLQFVVQLFQSAAPSATRGETPTARDVLDAGAERIGDALWERPRSRARILQTVGMVYLELYEYDRALPLLLESIELWREHDDRHARAQLASALCNLGDVLMWKGENDLAEERLRESLEIGREAFEEDDPRLVGTLRALGDALLIRDRPEEALPYRREALARVRENPRATPKHLAVMLGALGSCYLQLQDYGPADGPLTESLEVFRRDVGGPDPGFATTLSNLATLRTHQGRFEESEALFEEALAMSRALFADELDHSTLTTQANLAALKLHRARATGSRELMETALEEYLQAAAEFDRMLTPAHPRTLQVRASIGVILRELGRYDEAVALYEETLPLYRSSYGEGDIYTASGHLGLGECLLELGNASRAVEELQRALDIMDPLENFDPMKVRGHCWMGRAQLLLGDEALAREHFERGLAFESIVPDAEHLPEIRRELGRLNAAPE